MRNLLFTLRARTRNEARALGRRNAWPAVPDALALMIVSDRVFLEGVKSRQLLLFSSDAPFPRSDQQRQIKYEYKAKEGNLLGDGKLSQVASDHVRLDLDLIEGFAIVL